MNCPRCKTPIGPLSDPDSVISCPGCGSRLMTRSAALRSQGGPKPAGTEAPPPPVPTPPDPPSSHTVPATPSAFLGTKPAATSSSAPVGSDTTRRRKGETKASRAEMEATLDLVLQEVRALRETQDVILRAIDDLRRAAASAAPAGDIDLAGLAGRDESAFSPIRDGLRKTVVLVDDDPKTREAAAAELRRAEVPVRAFDDGNAAISAIAQEKPDVIVLELGLGGEMGGKDLVNMIKATMEWVDIPIVLWTREAVSNQKEARQIHGADEVVLKSGGPAALVAHVINVFRR
jgi:CheY-like chemotaxis protein